MWARLVISELTVADRKARQCSEYKTSWFSRGWVTDSERGLSGKEAAQTAQRNAQTVQTVPVAWQHAHVSTYEVVDIQI